MANGEHKTTIHTRKNNQLYYILVEGNIAVGKSTFIQRLREKLGPHATIIGEPVDQWTNLKGTNLLKEMYLYPHSRSFHIQSYIQLTMAVNQQQFVQTPIKIMERSLDSGRHVFTEAMKLLGHIDNTEYNILDEWYKWLDTKNMQTHEIIYLRTTPDIAFQRLQERQRPEEKEVTLEYLTLIHDLHDKWLMNAPQLGSPKVRIVNQNQSLKQTLSAADSLATELKNKFNSN